ncbi:hypothetical protein HOF92_15720, partial [bacterium]|nr:hypothetical protein [bacterium]
MSKDEVNSKIEVLIVGAGTMGASLAQAYAQSGFQTGLLDIDEPVLNQALMKIDQELQGAAKSRIFSQEQVLEIKGRIQTSTDYTALCSSSRL